MVARMLELNDPTGIGDIRYDIAEASPSRPPRLGAVLLRFFLSMASGTFEGLERLDGSWRGGGSCS